MKTKVALLLLFATCAVTGFASPAKAGCSPCICGPGGPYPPGFDLEEWFIKNCGKVPKNWTDRKDVRTPVADRR